MTTNAALFNERVAVLMENLSLAAAGSPSKFATGRNTTVNNFNFVYGMLQCTSDLSDNTCYSCLQNIIGDIPSSCNWRSGGNVYTDSCFLRYDSCLFFNLLSPAPPSSTQQASPLALSPPRPAVDGGATTTTNSTRGKGDGDLTLIIIGSLVILLVIVTLLAIAVRVGWLRRTSRKKNGTKNTGNVDSHLFDLRTLKVATKGFSKSNKLGKGGSGTVYKGKLSDGREIAVKRLSSSSPQNSEKIKSEILVVAKLQHRNLVRLLGCCAEEQVKLLVYEYLHNLSLNYYLFD
ncbi:putative cysteine-rich receptor-like protein kinase 35 [Macadamia integrifolia]|uniref:putative cysteine-rich receptor-like protein kinase 35 n=1 Tax=Macadamia integrifolia TaxID=60698 RepID=UPI001C4F8E28|nr:putative cysteine-rich receptor-like protein kinase 35 [Macadamia integrifolia]